MQLCERVFKVFRVERLEEIAEILNAMSPFSFPEIHWIREDKLVPSGYPFKLDVLVSYVD